MVPTGCALRSNRGFLLFVAYHFIGTPPITPPRRVTLLLTQPTYCRYAHRVSFAKMANRTLFAGNWPFNYCFASPRFRSTMVYQ